MRNPISIPIKDHERFLSKIRIDKNNECWNWIPCEKTKKSPVLIIGRIPLSARKISYSIFIDSKNTSNIGMECENRNCINPDHMMITGASNFKHANKFSLSGKYNGYRENCPKGHAFDNKNTKTWVDKKGGEHRVCISCIKEKGKKVNYKLKFERHVNEIYKSLLEAYKNDPT